MLNGNGLDRGLAVLAGALVLLLVFAALRRSPRIAVCAWLLVVGFVPIWVGVTAGAFFPAFSVVSLLTAFSLLPALRRFHWSAADVLLVVVLVLVVVEFVLRITTRGPTFDAVTVWASAYLFGRLLGAVADVRWVYGAVAVAFSGVAVLALAEFLTGTNLFISYLGNDTRIFGQWNTQQARGDVLRAEGAFGHSIALGTSLAVAVAFTLGSRFRPVVKVALLGLLGAATVVTFSRTGMLVAALAVLFSCWCLREQLSRRFRGLLVLLLAAGAALAYGYLRDVFVASGTEAAGSALYRSELLELIGYVQPLGLASNFEVATTQVVSVGEFGSIDNALLLFALIFGWLPAALVVLLLAGSLTYLLRRRATPATVALVAQIPALLTVALITQYASVFWFSAGLAVATQVALKHRDRPSAAAGRTPAAPGRPRAAASLSR